LIWLDWIFSLFQRVKVQNRAEPNTWFIIYILRLSQNVNSTRIQAFLGSEAGLVTTPSPTFPDLPHRQFQPSGPEIPPHPFFLSPHLTREIAAHESQVRHCYSTSIFANPSPSLAGNGSARLAQNGLGQHSIIRGESLRLYANMPSKPGMKIPKKSAPTCSLQVHLLPLRIKNIFAEQPSKQPFAQNKKWQPFGPPRILLILFDFFGSSGRTRTYNPSVNSRMLCH